MVRKTILERVKNLKTSKKLDYISLIKDPEYLQIYRYHMNQDEKLRSNRILDLICNSYDYSIEEIYRIINEEENEMSTKKNTKRNKVNKKREEKTLKSFAELAEEINADELEKIPVDDSKIEGGTIIDDIINDIDETIDGLNDIVEDVEVIEPSDKKVVNHKKTKEYDGPIDIIINKDVETISNVMAKEEEKEPVIIKDITSEKSADEKFEEDEANEPVIIKDITSEKSEDDEEKPKIIYLRSVDKIKNRGKGNVNNKNTDDNSNETSDQFGSIKSYILSFSDIINDINKKTDELKSASSSDDEPMVENA